MSIETIDDVVAAQLCTGCGVCAYMEPSRFCMADTYDHGRRPFLRNSAVRESGEALSACPGIGLAHDKNLRRRAGMNLALFERWGPVYGVWEGYAADADIRYSGSSGGVATALALYCLQQEGMAGVLHTAAREDVPYLNQTVVSSNRDELLARTGSRYAPASPAEALGRIEAAQTKSVFIGKPCDAAAVQNARKTRPRLDEMLGLVVAFFCAGVPSTRGNLELLKSSGVDDPATVNELRYRGKGWPGMWAVRFANRKGHEETRQKTYAESWGFLQRYRQWRCYICPDHTGEFADIAVGDPWYREVQAGEAGKSLIVARTPRGLQAIKAAARAGYLVLECEDPSLLPQSQKNLLQTRATLWGRMLVLSLLGVAVPRYRGFYLFHAWLRCLGGNQKIQSIAGTAKRVFTKGLRNRIKVDRWEPVCSDRPSQVL